MAAEDNTIKAMEKCILTYSRGGYENYFLSSMSWNTSEVKENVMVDALSSVAKAWRKLYYYRFMTNVCAKGHIKRPWYDEREEKRISQLMINRKAAKDFEEYNHEILRYKGKIYIGKQQICWLK